MSRSANMSERFDFHEPFFPKKIYELYPPGVAIRSLIRQRTPRSLHDQLHAECEGVPMPDFLSLEYITRRLDKPRTAYDGVEMYSRLAEEAAKQPHVTDIQQTILEMSVAAVRQQLPHLREMQRANRLDNKFTMGGK